MKRKKKKKKKKGADVGKELYAYFTQTRCSMSRGSGTPRTGGRFPTVDWGVQSGHWLPGGILTSGWLLLRWVSKTPSRTGTQTWAPGLKQCLWETYELQTQCSSWPPPFPWWMVVSVEQWIWPSWRNGLQRWEPWCYFVRPGALWRSQWKCLTMVKRG